MDQLYFETASELRTWLQENHDKSSGVWLVFFKKESDKPTLNYEESVEEALCFGWIDSVIKKIDEYSYVRKFTPRKDGSNWSNPNKKRVKKLIKEGRMTEVGMAKVEIAKQNGEWDKPDTPRQQLEMPEEFHLALQKNKKAREFFNTLSKTDQKPFIMWVASAKRPETREKRVKESIGILEKGQKLGLK